MLPVVFVLSISLAVACATKKVPVTLISSIRRKVVGENVVDGPFRDSPAQATSPFSG